MKKFFAILSCLLCLGTALVPAQQLSSSGAGATPFTTVSAVPNLLAWHKASAGLWKDTAGTLAATADADAVARWDDQSTNARHATQATSTKRPLLKLAIKNGKNVVRFDGVDDFLQGPSFTGVSMPYTVFIVFAGTGAANNSRCYFDLDATNVFLLKHTSLAWNYFGGTSLNGFGSTDTNFHVMSIVFNGATSKHRLDGGAEAMDTFNTGSTQATQVTLACLQTGASTNAAGCDIGEFIVVSGEPSLTNKIGVFNYLDTFWGVY